MTYNAEIEINVKSEIGKLNGVILHKPGIEVENMTPQNAERALYSDILNLQVCQKEYAQLEGVLSKVSQTFQVKKLLQDILENQDVKMGLIHKICNQEESKVHDCLLEMDSEKLAAQIIEGVEENKNNLTKFLSKEKFSLRPLHNFFFTRDASVSINNKVLISKMASKVREREALVMESIFNYHPSLRTKTVNPLFTDGIKPEEITIEGGDVLVAREDILLIGVGGRTTSQGVDFILEKFKQNQRDRHIFIQELPLSPESFIHLDMVFTFLDKNYCMVYEPVILTPNRYQTVHIEVKNGEVISIQKEDNLLKGLAKLGMELTPLYCGGRDDKWNQAREQWHSGANFFAFAPGKVIGYGRNIHTIDDLNQNGFDVLAANDIISGKCHPDDYQRCVVTIDGSELPRGGGGARCMTMPINRDPVNW